MAWGNSVNNFEIHVSPHFYEDIEDFYEDSVGIRISDYANFTIKYVDGVPAADYFLKYANHSAGTSKDIGTRFNEVMTLRAPEPNPDGEMRYDTIYTGSWQKRSYLQPFPESESVEYGLVSPSGEFVTVTLPWCFNVRANIDGVEEFQEKYVSGQRRNKTGDYVRAASEWSKNGGNGNDASSSIMKLDAKAKRAIADDQLRAAKNYFGNDAASMTFELLLQYDVLTFWKLSDNRTVVMRLSSMLAEPEETIQTLLKGFKLASENGLDRLIIDLTNNGGGNACFTRALISIFQNNGWEGQGQNWGPQDLPLSPLAEQLIRSAAKNDVEDTVWSPAFYQNQKNEQLNNSDISHLIPGVPHSRGGLMRNYTRLVHINKCGDWGDSLITAVKFKASQTLIITRGHCGSACALFANHLRLYDGVRTVVLGGIPSRPVMQYTSFPGTQVLDKDVLFGQFIKLKQNVSYVPYKEMNPADVVPRDFATSATFRICVREIYPPSYAPNVGIPMEFNFQPADYHLYNTALTAWYPEYVWYEVLPLFH